MSTDTTTYVTPAEYLVAERESPTKRIFQGPGEIDESGTNTFKMPPNEAVATRRIGTFVTSTEESES